MNENGQWPCATQDHQLEFVIVKQNYRKEVMNLHIYSTHTET